MTWVQCECGCGFEGEDPVAQYLLEEALMARLEQHDTRLKASAMEDVATDAAVTRSLGRAARLQQEHG